MTRTRLSIALVLVLCPWSGIAADRDQELELLKTQLAALQARVAELEAKSVQRDAGPAVAGVVAQSQPKAVADAQPGSAGKPAAIVETRGGLKVASADGKASFSVAGRIHFDGYLFDPDLAEPTSTTDFRRSRLTLQGKARGWDYKLEQDFAAGTNLDGLRDAYVARPALGGKLTIGQFKPYRAMEELTSSNEILMMERPFASATGLFTGRQFQQGIGYLRSGDHYTAGFSAFNLRGAGAVRNEGYGYAGRVTFAPINDDSTTVHVGAWASSESVRKNTPALMAVANYAGRRGPTLAIATTDTDSGESVAAHGIEAAGAFGPFFVQGEYARSTFGQQLSPDQDVVAWYLQGSWHLNGGHKPYKSATGVFGSAPVADIGLWELTARYDTMRNRDVAGRAASSWLFGLNYYINANLRLMLNLTRGDNEVTGDETSQFGVRTQFTF